VRSGSSESAPAELAPGTLYLVATPIGNLGDMTARGLAVLRAVDWIAAEDTRHTGLLLAHFGLRKPLLSAHAQREAARAREIAARLARGETGALVVDAGTPGVSDPGFRLVRAAIEAGIRVEAIPGASAVLAALVASGLPTSSFAFLGFPPAREQARERWLRDLAGRPETLVLFEAPHRVRQTLEAALGALGDRPAVVARELTKLHEEVSRGTLSSLLAAIPEPRGEFTLVIGPSVPGARPAAEKPDEAALLEEFCRLTEDKGLRRRAAISELARAHAMPSRQVYAAIEQARRRG
jgi:16S rRNA (cytidine1402-2'-O)-methyltransferase